VILSVEAGPDLETDGVVRWRCVDLRRVIKERFGVDLDEVSVGRLLKRLGYAPRQRQAQASGTGPGGDRGA
jgi:transposase